jgi:hypothetical protein
LLRVARGRHHLEQLLGAEVAERPLRHQERGITLGDGLASEAQVALLLQVRWQQRIEVEVLVLEGVRELMAHRDLLEPADPRAPGDDPERLVLGVVEAQHLARQQVDVKLRRASSEEARRLKRPSWAGELDRRCLLVELATTKAFRAAWSNTSVLIGRSRSSPRSPATWPTISSVSAFSSRVDHADAPADPRAMRRFRRLERRPATGRRRALEVGRGVDSAPPQAATKRDEERDGCGRSGEMRGGGVGTMPHGRTER